MTRDEFLALPAPVALRVLFDCLDEDTAAALRAKEKPTIPRSPKYDTVVFRSGGVVFASEMDMEGLRFWQGRSTEPGGDPKYADSNAKRADGLARFMAWRECFPDATWSGERNREAVVALPPSSKPKVHERSGGRRPPPPPDDDMPPMSDDDQIPF